MKKLFIHAKSDLKIQIPKSIIAKLPKDIAVFTTIQHMYQIKDILKQIPSSILGGQVLGCDQFSAKKTKAKHILYIGSGHFHPIALALQSEKKVYIYNPFTKKLSTLKDEDLEPYRKRQRASLIKFLSSDKIGILVSTKHGQNRIDEAILLSKSTDKEYFIFAFDTLNPLELENFPFIQSWVNTACPRIADEKNKIINIDEIPK